jgi:hypothetical protein
VLSALAGITAAIIALDELGAIGGGALVGATPERARPSIETDRRVYAAACRLMCVAGIAKACYALDNGFRMP